MNNETLVYNPAALEDLSNTLNSRLREFEDAIGAMFQTIDTEMNQPDHWSGSTYDQLKDKCDNFRSTKIEVMANNLKAYVNHFDKTSTEAAETTTSVEGIVTRDAIENADITGQN